MNLKNTAFHVHVDLYWLHKMCEDYDAENGHYPESEYEGKAVFDFIMKSLTEDMNKIKEGE